MAVRAQVGRGFVEAIAVAVGARDLADVFLMTDREPHLAPLRGHVDRGARTIAESARDKADRDRNQREHEPTFHRAPVG